MPQQVVVTAYRTRSGWCAMCRKRVESRAPEQPPAANLPHGQLGLNALATGVLTHMEFDVVSALSLTYSIQEDFENRARGDRPRFTPSESLPAGDARIRLDEAYDYVSALSQDESELMTVYDQALEMIALHRAPDHVDADQDSSSTRESASGGS